MLLAVTTQPSPKPSHGCQIKDLIRQTLIKIIKIRCTTTTTTDTTATAAMGCVSSKGPELDAAAAGFSSTNAANLFQVMNVDDTGRRLCPGQLEVGETDLILYQRGKDDIRWPLRSLRRYGFDAGLFSFECGRRCPTGPGIYAFHCPRAEFLFNCVQARVAARHDEHHELGAMISGALRSRIIRHSLPSSSRSSASAGRGGGGGGGAASSAGVGGLFLMPRSSSSGNGNGNNVVTLNHHLDRDDMTDEDGSYLEPIRLHQQHVAMWASVSNSRPLSSASLISNSSSPISPSATAGNLYANNEALLAAAVHHQQQQQQQQHNETTFTAAVVADQHPSTMAADPLEAAAHHLVPPPVAYANMNESPSRSQSVQLDGDDIDDDSAQHLYINVGLESLEIKESRQLSDVIAMSNLNSGSNLMMVPIQKKVNYVLLDLDKGSDSTTTASVTTTTTGGGGGGGGAQLNSPQGSLASFPDSPPGKRLPSTADPTPAPSSSSASSSTTAHHHHHHRQLSLSAAAAAASAIAAISSSEGGEAAAAAGSQQQQQQQGYAMIDFDKTAALGVAFCSPASYEEEEQGLRKTRHNSTMMATSTSTHNAARLLGFNRQTSSVSE